MQTMPGDDSEMTKATIAMQTLHPDDAAASVRILLEIDLLPILNRNHEALILDQMFPKGRQRFDMDIS